MYYILIQYKGKPTVVGLGFAAAGDAVTFCEKQSYVGWVVVKGSDKL
jgi:hypothetical protein